jgi:hypothetical protein
VIIAIGTLERELEVDNRTNRKIWPKSLGDLKKRESKNSAV